MFTKVLVSEDYESFSISVKNTLHELEVLDVHTVHYCDDAINKTHRSLREEHPFQLLITDLSFEEDHREQQIKNGKELILEIRSILPEIKVLVFSVDRKPALIQDLFEKYGIDAYVAKGRGDTKEMKKAVQKVWEGEKFYPSFYKKNNVIELVPLEYHILNLLSNGVIQKNIPDHLQEKNIKPSSLSSVEKALGNLKETFGANSNEHLISITKDLGII